MLGDSLGDFNLAGHAVLPATQASPDQALPAHPGHTRMVRPGLPADTANSMG